ncbi:hypothetical protein GGTG_11441 [Gaeumannomyces tritici R3-111a-1]|uniref:Uncharacterized protein n=1 Tax=Gaeumannomyces tritici (strain R3-111a-1) TaxID=644352 RepID=J3PD72_GAET3|nr:hypothetical protein GGTG_11441 [Gaeumannomyces tritici R3-111a-1]EJT70417.1 hypothetical protein GGTG_11441 [Gaeumannomyces tritici R3-111a-1]
MDDGSSPPAEPDELRDQIDLQRAIVASLMESSASGDLSGADPQTLADAEVRLVTLQSKMDFLDTEAQRQARGMPGTWSPQLKTEAGPSRQLPRMPPRQSPIKSEPAGRHQPKTEPGLSPDHQMAGPSSWATAMMPEHGGLPSRGPKIEPGSSSRTAGDAGSASASQEIQSIISALEKAVNEKSAQFDGLAGSREYMESIIEEMDSDVKFLIAIEETRVVSLLGLEVPRHPDIDRILQSFQRRKLAAQHRLGLGTSPGSTPGPGSYTTTPSTGSDSSLVYQAQSRAGSRKRSFGTHIKDEPAPKTYQSKFMRTSDETPGFADPFEALPDNSSAPDHDIIDLTVDDDEIDQQILRHRQALHEQDHVAKFEDGVQPWEVLHSRDIVPSHQDYQLPEYAYESIQLASRPAPACVPSQAIYGTPSMHIPGAYPHNYIDLSSDEPQPISLHELTRRANNIDFENVMNGNGNPLYDRLQDFLGAGSHAEREEEQIRNLFKSCRPDIELQDSEQEDTPEALKFPLFPHQRLALKWMMGMEQDQRKKGGILADDMGLGKTISTLSLMVARPGQEADLKTNLIIGPVALVRQWEAEIKAKLKNGHRMQVFLLHGQKRLPFEKLKTYDVVLTTYGTIAAEFKRMGKYRETHRNKSEGQLADDKVFQKQCPLLHNKSRFWRIILDEAQCVKNHNTQAAKAVHALQGEHRWCLSGTPMMNGAHELFSLFQFLRIGPYDKQKLFNKAFGALKPSGRNSTYSRQSLRNNALKQLQVVLQALMLRREKTSQINGKPILDLPPKIEEVVHVCFSADETAFYRDLETSSQNQVNKYMRAGTLRKNYSNVLVLLLRLRQACCHPNLNFDVEYTVDSGVSADQMLELAKMFEQHVVDRLKEAESFECPICYDAVQDPKILFPCGHELCGECLSRLASNSEQDNIQAGEGGSASTLCPQCRGRIDSRKVVNYGTFKKVYMPENAAAEEVSGEQDDDSDGDSDGASDDDKWKQPWESDSDSGEDSETDDEEADDEGNLRDFVVADDAISDGEDEAADDSDDDLEPRKAEKPSTSRGKQRLAIKDSDDEDEKDSDDMDLDPYAGASASSKGKGKAVEGSGDDMAVTTGAAAKRAQNKARRRDAKTAAKRKAKADSEKRSKGKGKEKVKPHQLQTLRKDASRNKAARNKYMNYLYNNWISSAKVSRCTQLLSEIQERGEKTLVFSVWTGLLDLLEVAIMRDLGLHVCRYDGGMTRDQRDSAAFSFQNNPRSTIMLVSLRAGNAGLNLTAASQVIIMDPFWNPFIEMQAVDRAHRMGQMRTVNVHRILVKGTVEDRISALQEQKRSLVNAALNEGDAKDVARLSTKELMYLFGIGDRR